jgi:hypothetical protein
MLEVPMRVLVLIFSLIWMALGVALILYIEKVRSSFKALFDQANIRAMAAFPLVIGLVFLAASYSQGEVLPLFLILGALAVSKGIYLLFGPITQIKDLLAWWSVRASETAIRAWGIVSLVLGIAVFSCVLRS